MPSKANSHDGALPPLDSAVYAKHRAALERRIDSVAMFRAAMYGETPPLIERVYEDSVQDPLTASEQGRD